MRKLSINRIKLMLVAALVAIAFACVGFMTFAKAENTFTSLADIDVTMDGYALIVEGEDGINGLEFTISAPQAQYSAMVGSVGEGKAYASVETGIIIAPAYYNDEIAINQDSLFNSPEYDWANYVDGEWVYSGDKIQVININANDWVDLGDTVTYSGGIVDIRPENENVAMYSVGYIKLVDSEGVATYKFTDSSEISVVAAAVQAYDNLSGSQKIWVDTNWLDILPIIEEDVVLKNVAGAATYNVLDTVTANASVKNIMDGFTSAEGLSATMTDASGNVVDIDLENPVVDVTEDLLRVWDIEIKAGEFVLYQGTVDIYDSARGIVWTTEDDILDSFVMFYPNSSTGITMTMPTVEKEYVEFTDAAENTQKVIKVTGVANWAGGEPSDKYYTVLPVHSKEYYAQYVGKDIELEYGFYAESEFDGYVIDHAFWYGNSSTINCPSKDTWYENKLSLDDIVENWDIIMNPAPEGSYTWGTRYAMHMGYIGDWTRIGAGVPATLYFKGFNLKVDVSKLAMQGGDILVKLDDVADKTALDLTAYMKAEDVEAINSVAGLAGVSYEMKGYSIADTIEVTDLTAVDVSGAKEAAYILTITSAGAPLYTATFDLYTSTNPVVWAESMTAENVILRKTAYQVGWPSKVIGTLVAGTDYEFVDSLTVGEKTYEGSFVKVTVSEAMNIALDIKALHTKAYYQEMSDLTKVLHIRGLFPASVSMGANFSANNYGMNNAYGTWRNSTAKNTYESIVISMDNYLIASNTSTASGKFYDWTKITGDNCSQGNTMLQFEIPDGLINTYEKEGEDFVLDENGDKIVETHTPFVFYLGNTEVTTAGETLVSSESKYAKTSFDLSTATSFDLAEIIPEAQRAKLVAMAKAWGESVGKHSASAVGFNLTVNGVTHSVKPDAEGRFIVNLDDTIVNKDGTLLEGYQVRDILLPGNNSVSIIGYAPPVTSMGVSSWPVTMVAEGTITIVGPAAAAE